MTLRESLVDWTDFDAAGYKLAVCLGFMPDVPGMIPSQLKGIFWSANPLGEMLGRWLDDLVELGILETNEDQQFRYNRSYSLLRNRYDLPSA